MCCGCWKEEYGAPTNLPDNAREIMDAIDLLYATEGCGTGGPLHVQVEDNNVEVEWKPYNGPGGSWYSDLAMQRAQVVADFMTPLSIDQRAAVMAKYNGCF
jgi:hypothetical protein